MAGTRTLGLLVLTAIIGVAASVSVHAHHSQTMYDLSTLANFEGTVRQVRWNNPHTWVYVDVEGENGQAQTWVLEGAGPGSVQELGVSQDDVRQGDRISVRCHPLKDSSAGCVLGWVTPLHGDPARGHGIERAWN